MRKQFEMTDEERTKIMNACKPAPAIMLHIGNQSSPQERANRAWQALAKKRGFVRDTVKHVPGKPETVFSAEVARDA